MAIRVDTQDLDNYPGTVKVVTIDQNQIVPAGYEGDEKYIYSFATTAYSDNTNNTSIQTIYITNFKGGWCKSSGFTGLNSNFSLSSSHCKMRIKLDATVSGSDGSGWYEITLDHSDGAYLPGESVAEDMETKIRAIADSIHTSDAGFILSYKNASVEFIEGNFWVLSGSVSKYYTGTTRSSVQITSAGSNDAAAMLGFDLSVTSEDLAGVSVEENVLTQDYTANSSDLHVGLLASVQPFDCLVITDGTNTDYFTAISGTTTTLVKVATMGSHNYVGIGHNYSYTTAASGTGTKVQILREQDPTGEPVSYYTDIDSITRFGLKSIINQIDYSS